MHYTCRLAPTISFGLYFCILQPADATKLVVASTIRAGSAPHEMDTPVSDGRHNRHTHMAAMIPARFQVTCVKCSSRLKPVTDIMTYHKELCRVTLTDRCLSDAADKANKTSDEY